MLRNQPSFYFLIPPVVDDLYEIFFLEICFAEAAVGRLLVKVIHHRWNQKVERGPNNEVPEHWGFEPVTLGLRVGFSAPELRRCLVDTA